MIKTKINGQLLSLSDGREARVVRQSPALLKPVVRLNTNHDGDRVYAAEEIDVDLSVTMEGVELTVTEVVKEEFDG